MGTAYLNDPVLALIDPEEMPNTFLLMSDEEQMWRGRLYLKYLWGSHHKPWSWANALTDDESWKLTDTDEFLLALMRGYAAEVAMESEEGL